MTAAVDSRASRTSTTSGRICRRSDGWLRLSIRCTQPTCCVLCESVTRWVHMFSPQNIVSAVVGKVWRCIWENLQLVFGGRNKPWFVAEGSLGFWRLKLDVGYSSISRSSLGIFNELRRSLNGWYQLVSLLCLANLCQSASLASIPVVWSVSAIREIMTALAEGSGDFAELWYGWKRSLLIVNRCEVWND
jgi:hypothetical protein